MIRIEKSEKTLPYEEFSSIDSIVFPTDSMNPESYLKLSGAVIYYVKFDQRIIGYSVLLIDHAKSTSHLKRIGIAPEYRNRKIGNKLLRENLEYIESENITTMTLNVIQDNHAAVRLYKKNNFEIIDFSAQFEYSENITNLRPHFRLQPKSELISDEYKIDDCLAESIIGDDTIYYFIHKNQIHGYCNFDPNFPGCNYFALCDQKFEISEILNELLKNRKDTSLPIKITTADKNAIAVLEQLKMKKNYSLYKMRWGTT
jgi:ribosomal protein S18 acetylase RimI-like enzyme